MIDFILKISIIIVNYKCWLSSAYKLKKKKKRTMFAQVFINIACVYYGHGVQICGSVKTGIFNQHAYVVHTFVC